MYNVRVDFRALKVNILASINESRIWCPKMVILHYGHYWWESDTHYLLSVTKWLNFIIYPSVLCFFCSDLEVSDDKLARRSSAPITKNDFFAVKKNSEECEKRKLGSKQRIRDIKNKYNLKNRDYSARTYVWNETDEKDNRKEREERKRLRKQIRQKYNLQTPSVQRQISVAKGWTLVRVVKIVSLVKANCAVAWPALTYVKASQRLNEWNLQKLSEILQSWGCYFHYRKFRVLPTSC